MIITVEGRPLNGPLMTNSNTLKDPLIKGGSTYRERLASVFMDSIQKQKAKEQKQKAKEAEEAEYRRGFANYRDGHNDTFSAMHAAEKAKEPAQATQKVKESVQQAKGVSIEKDIFNSVLDNTRIAYQQDIFRSRGPDNIVKHAEQKAKESAQQPEEVTQPSEKAKEIPTLFSAVSKSFDKHLGENVSMVQSSQRPSNEEISNFKKLSKETKKNNILHGRTLLSFITLTWILNMCGFRTVALIWYYIWYYFIKFIYYLFILFILFVIFNICLIIWTVIQKSLDIAHFVVGGIARGMQKAIDVVGFKIFGKHLKLLGFLQGPTNHVKAADRKIPDTSFQVIKLIVYAFFKPYLK